MFVQALYKMKSLLLLIQKQRFASAVFWSFGGAVCQKILLLAASFLCMHILGKGGYGKMSIVRSTIQVLIILGAVGMGSTATKFLAEIRDTNKRKVQETYSIVCFLGVICGLFVTGIVLVFASNIANYLKDLSLITSIRIGAVLLFFSIINSIQTGILSGFEKFKEIALVSIYGGIAEFMCIICGSYFFSVDGALLGYGAGFICLTILNHFYIKKCDEHISFSIESISFLSFKKILLFSIPLLGSSLLVSPVMWYIQSLLVRKNGFEELSIYSAADQWRMVLLFVPSALSRVALPILSNLYGNKENETYLKMMKMNLYVNGGSALLFFVFFVIISPVVLKLYDFSLSCFRVFFSLAASTFFSSLAAVFGQAITSRSKVWIGFLYNLLWGVMVIAFTYIFLNMNLGALALSLGILLSYILHTFFQAFYFRKLIKSTFIKEG